jgi:hypothetical protein
MSRVIEDLTGREFGNWKVIRLAEDKKHDCHTYWYVQCSCGNTTYTRADSLKALKSRQCKKCKHLEQTKNDFALNTVYLNYQKGANRRGLNFELSKDKFQELISRNCFFCGTSPATIWKYAHTPLIYNGIDRLDNSRGYSEDNCVPCCKTCNYAKQTMSVEEFLAWITKVYTFQIKEYIH